VSHGRHFERYEGRDIMAASTKTYRPEQVASALGISGKIVRAYLRKTFPRPANAKGTTWVLDAKQAGDRRSSTSSR
jgi:hypothetical protein